MALRHLPNVLYETFRISWPTVMDGYRGSGSPERFDARLMDWSARILRCANLKLDIIGELPPASESFVVASNHQSLYDIPVLYQTLQRRLRMVAKSELFRVPLWSRAMRESGMVEIDRTDRRRALETLRRAAEEIGKGTNVWIAPEGTRSRDGVLGPFKKGALHLAMEAKSRILPITIDGTVKVLPANGWVMTPGLTVRVVVHEPVDPASYGKKRREELSQHVRSVIASGLPPEQRGEAAPASVD
jgi:1-acyl-sn-glycerol-3-phosphate acyltransferase